METGSAPQEAATEMRRGGKIAIGARRRSPPSDSLRLRDVHTPRSAYVELTIAGNVLMFGQSRRDNPGNSVRSPKEVNAMIAGINVVLPDAAAIDAMYAREAAAGDDQKGSNAKDYGSHHCSTRISTAIPGRSVLTGL